MKRTIFFRIFSGFNIFLYIMLILFSLRFQEVIFYQFWFSGLLLMVGVVSLTRFFCYKIDSSLFLGTVCLFCGVAGILNYFYLFNLPLLFGLYFSSFALGSLAIFIKFRQFFHLKTFVFETICAILLLLLSYGLLGLIPFIVLFSITILAIIILIISSIKLNTRKV